MDRPRTSERDHATLRDQIQHWLANRVDGPVVSDLEVPPSNGMSSETVMFEAAWFEGGVRRVQRCVLRLPPDPAAEPVFPTYDMARQYKAMDLVGATHERAGAAAAVAGGDPQYLGAPFFVMRRVDGLVPPDIMPYTFGDNWLFDAARRISDACRTRRSPWSPASTRSRPTSRRGGQGRPGQDARCAATSPRSARTTGGSCATGCGRR